MTWMLLTSGRGPVECQKAIGPIAAKLCEEATARGLSPLILDANLSEHGMYSCLVAIDGEGASDFARTWQGTVEWKCASSLRQTKRKNWFIGVRVIEEAPASTALRDKDMRFEAFRASGPGGQHVNTTSSAVRVVHVPTGLTAQAQEERSQHRNKALAVARLTEQIAAHQANAVQAVEQDKWSSHNTVVRGEPVKVFVGEAFRLQR